MGRVIFSPDEESDLFFFFFFLPFLFFKMVEGDNENFPSPSIIA